uniref:Uncharacterized protein n=1 Tax=Heterorhabditis bacteriophora TaxID=37862 RepID=A0A1I7XKP7_HETBA
MNQILTSSADDVDEKSKSNTAVDQTPHLIYDHGVDGEAIIIQDEHGNATIYAPQQVQHLADIDDIGDEVEVQNNGKLAWILPMELRSDDLVTRKNNTMKEHLKPSSVLLTNENLRSRPQMFVGAGKTVIDRSKQASQWGDPGDMPGTSSGDGAPGMKSLFRLYADAALRKVCFKCRFIIIHLKLTNLYRLLMQFYLKTG